MYSRVYPHVFSLGFIVEQMLQGHSGNSTYILSPVVKTCCAEFPSSLRSTVLFFKSDQLYFPPFFIDIISTERIIVNSTMLSDKNSTEQGYITFVLILYSRV